MRDYLKNAIENLHRYNYSIGHRIYLMGRINHILLIKAILEEKGYAVEGILDNDSKKQGLEVEGVKIFAPGDISKRHDNKIAIIIYSPKYSQSMVKQCEEYGYIEGEDIFVIDKPTLERNKRLVEIGVAKYEELKNKYGNDAIFFYANCPLGDYYLLSLFFRKYCEKNEIKNPVIICNAHTDDTLSKILDLKPTEKLSVLEYEAIATAWIFLGEKEMDIIPMTIWQGSFRFNPCLIRQSEDFTFIDTFKYMVFHLNESDGPDFYDFSDQGFDANGFAAEKGLVPGKTVLISPFSYSLQSLPQENWVKIAQYIISKGYSVAINVGQSGEENFIPGTVSVSLDFTKIVKLMELTAAVIGIRSGFFDITCHAKCKRIVLYPFSNGVRNVWNSTDISFCSLKNMGLTTDAFELEVSGLEDVLKLIDEVLPNI
ncbi:nucleoside-diphosphate sugar epimerase/dehydratase [Butyrivibrio sp. AE3004]|uniref:nucleoside-diphosphate sugar epimerase/dehydratase n=1 Tax=Butyrivibrio sp. AE3004 TaxID=1506994 RepID=UPI0004942CDD|nr:hypothetical protein [Butyrivibrio sp. AE3004]